jgi:hypothetical protein
MRFYEFAPVRYIKTPAVTNAPAEPVISFQNIPVVPDAVKHQRWQQMKAAEFARSANQVQPTEIDMVKAQWIYADQQRQANQDYEQQSRRLRRDATSSIVDAKLGRRRRAPKLG